MYQCARNAKKYYDKKGADAKGPPKVPKAKAEAKQKAEPKAKADAKGKAAPKRSAK